MGRYLELPRGRASSRIRCCPPPMVWQEVARNLASREAKVYERIQDGTSIQALSSRRFIVAVLAENDDLMDARIVSCWLMLETF